VQLDAGESIGDYVKNRIAEGRIYLGIEGDEDLLPVAIDLVGDAPFMFSSDFPHEVNLHTVRHELDELLENGKLADSTKHAILGHEIVGELVAVDPEAKRRWGVEAGARVAVEALVRCGGCESCQLGRGGCSNPFHYSATAVEVGCGLWGGMAQYMELLPGSGV